MSDADLTIEVAFGDWDAVDHGLLPGLEQGIVFVSPASGGQAAASLRPLAEVRLVLTLPGGTEVEVVGEVLQVLEAPGTRGVTVRLADPAAFRAALDRARAAADTLEVELPASGPEGEAAASEAMRIRAMNVSERMRYATSADRPGRAVLLRDHSPQVLRLLLRNPRLTADDVLQLARNGRTTADILSELARDRRWSGSEELRAAIVRHPHAPTPLALNLLTTLSERNLRELAKSQQVREAVKRHALTLLLRRREGRERPS